MYEIYSKPVFWGTPNFHTPIYNNISVYRRWSIQCHQIYHIGKEGLDEKGYCYTCPSGGSAWHWTVVGVKQWLFILLSTSINPKEHYQNWNDVALPTTHINAGGTGQYLRYKSRYCTIQRRLKNTNSIIIYSTVFEALALNV